MFPATREGRKEGRKEGGGGGRGIDIESVSARMAAAVTSRPTEYVL